MPRQNRQVTYRRIERPVRKRGESAAAGKSVAEQGRSEAPSARHMVVLTAVIALATVVYCIISFWQWKATNRSAEIAEQSVRLGARAYLGLVTMTLDDSLAATRKTGIKGIFRNAGHTPAYNVVVKSYYLFSQDGFRPDPNDQIAARPAQIGLLLPNEDLAYTFVVPPLSEEQAKRVMEGSTKLYLYGFIEYEDIFQHQHTMKFCGTYSPTEFTSFFRCPTHNEELKDVY